MLEITHLKDAAWQRAMPQRQGSEVFAIHLKILFSGPEQMVTYTRYDPGLVVAPHRHEGT